MANLKGWYLSGTDKWATPQWLYDQLHAEFGFTLDPCPIGWSAETHPNGLALNWQGHRVFCNPPYGRHVDRWLAKASTADLAVYLLPARTDTAWWHQYAELATERRFLRGRLKYNDGKERAPFPSVILVYKTHS